MRRVAYVKNATATELADAILAAERSVVVVQASDLQDPRGTWPCSITGVVAQRDKPVVLVAHSDSSPKDRKPAAAAVLVSTLRGHGDARVLVSVDGLAFQLYSVMAGPKEAGIMVVRMIDQETDSMDVDLNGPNASPNS